MLTTYGVRAITYVAKGDGKIADQFMAVTRSHKLNDRDHVGLANGTAAPEEHLPRYFAKSGYVANDPNRTKKAGNGRGNWGRQGSEFEDMPEFNNKSNPRRHSNSSANIYNTFSSKFEVIEHEPVFEESVHGASAEDYAMLEKTTSTDSAPSDAGTVSTEGGMDEK